MLGLKEKGKTAEGVKASEQAEEEEEEEVEKSYKLADIYERLREIDSVRVATRVQSCSYDACRTELRRVRRPSWRVWALACRSCAPS